MRTETVFLWFIIYSFIGWLYETILCSAKEKKFVYRGFLNGPYCPIYGFGALLVLYALGRIENPVILFFSSALLTCTLEYITSFVMEKLFHARWWDYSDMKFNINGRVCLLGFAAFGTFSVLFLKYLHPLVVRLTSVMPPELLKTIAWILLVIFCSDIGVTLQGFAGFGKKLAAFGDNMKTEIKSDIETNIKAAKQRRAERIEELRAALNLQEKRMLSAFPKLTVSKRHDKLNKYSDALAELKERLGKKTK